MNTCDYDFDEARKPCGTGEGDVKPSGKCIENAGRDCRWFPMCDLSEKNPPKPPTLPKKFIKPLRGANITLFSPGTQFLKNGIK